MHQEKKKKPLIPILQKLSDTGCEPTFQCDPLDTQGGLWRSKEQEEKGTTEDEMVGWHHRLDGHEFE